MGRCQQLQASAVHEDAAHVRGSWASCLVPGSGPRRWLQRRPVPSHTHTLPPDPLWDVARRACFDMGLACALLLCITRCSSALLEDTKLSPAVHSLTELRCLSGQGWALPPAPRLQALLSASQATRGQGCSWGVQVKGSDRAWHMCLRLWSTWISRRTRTSGLRRLLHPPGWLKYALTPQGSHLKPCTSDLPSHDSKSWWQSAGLRAHCQDQKGHGGAKIGGEDPRSLHCGSLYHCTAPVMCTHHAVSGLHQLPQGPRSAGSAQAGRCSHWGPAPGRKVATAASAPSGACPCG